ncbi:MAG: AtpZ/AtpI family protein [Lachnospiraceae bacterium]|nr:AtpZ/AtpI family protein [Lachnospiraceae bacterium]
MKYKKEVFQSFTFILQFGINMLVPIFLCTFLGMFIDRKLGTSYVFIIMFFIGAIAGGRNVFILARKIYSKPSDSRNIKGAHISEGYDAKEDKVDKPDKEQ